MKTYIALLLLFSANCISAPVQLNTDLRFYDQGKLVKEKQMGRTGKYEISMSEEGKIGNVRYRFWLSDGSGTFQGEPDNTLDLIKDNSDSNWSLRCDRDNMTDKVTCSATKYDLTVSYFDNGSKRVSLGSNNYPDSAIYARIDNGSVMQGPGDGYFALNDGKDIISALLSGKTVNTQWQEWPYQSNKEGSVSGYGFKEVSDYMNWVLTQKKSKS